MSADFLASFSRAKDSNYWHFGLMLQLRASHIASKLRIIRCWLRLIMINTVEPNTEELHIKYDLSQAVARKQVKVTCSYE